jgi:hypothetical protein
MNGIGKIAAGMVGQERASQEADSRAPWITGSLKTRKHQMNVGLGFQALALGSSMYSTYQKGIKPYEDIQAGAKAAGIEMDEASFGEKLKIGFGFQDVGLEETYETTTGKTQEISGVEGGWRSNLTMGDDEDTPYKPTSKNVTELTGANLMDIGARSKSGTLESYVSQQGDDKTIAGVFGKDVTTDKFWDDAFEGRSDSDPSLGTYQRQQSHTRPPDPFLQDYENKMKNYSSSMSMMDEVNERYSPLREGTSVDEQGYISRGDTSGLLISSDPEQAFKMAYGNKPFGASFKIDEHGEGKNVGWLKRGDKTAEFMRDGRLTFRGWGDQ